MLELIYANDSLREVIQKEFPEAKVEDASDDIHPERFSVEIKINESQNEEDVLEKFYIFAIKEGFAMLCLGFQMMVMQKDELAKVKHYMRKAGLKVD